MELGIGSCTKAPSTSHDNLSLIRQKWDLISKRMDTIRYIGRPGDYYNFNVNGKLYEYYGQNKDTFVYVLNGQQGIDLYPYINGSRLPTVTNFRIDVLTNSRLVISATISPGVTVVDSLSR